MIDELKAVGLYGSAVVPVVGSLVDRYNGCLAMLGISPTKLKEISIDGMGWSPEVAEEKEDIYYLNIGEANSNAIILTPEQKGKPVHMPFHSFDRDIMTTIFAAYPKQIRDITKDSAICVHLDQEIDAYYEPFDLLRYKKLTLSFKLLNELEKHQQAQLALVEEFGLGNNFIDKKLHNKILRSAQEHGDLRKRILQLEPLSLEVKSFYTKAFGGIFVLRDFINDIIVFESLDEFNRAIKDTVHDVSLFHISHNELTATLVNHMIAEFDIKRAAKTDRYQRIKKHLFAQLLGKTKHSISEIMKSQLLYKKYLNQLEIEDRKKLMSVELYNQRKIVERDLKIEDVVDLQYTNALLQPHSSLNEEENELIWKLLTKISPLDPLHLYWYDKDLFYRSYPAWGASYREWVIDCILEGNKN